MSDMDFPINARWRKCTCHKPKLYKHCLPIQVCRIIWMQLSCLVELLYMFMSSHWGCHISCHILYTLICWGRLHFKLDQSTVHDSCWRWHCWLPLSRPLLLCWHTIDKASTIDSHKYSIAIAQASTWIDLSSYWASSQKFEDEIFEVNKKSSKIGALKIFRLYSNSWFKCTTIIDAAAFWYMWLASTFV